MKKVIAILVLSFLGLNTSNVIAQSADAKKTYSKVLNISADKVWKEIRKIDEIDKHSSSIARLVWKGKKGKGGQRICYSPDGKGYFKENIVDFSDDERTYSYSVIEGVPIKGMVNTWKVVDLGYNKSMIVWTTNYEQFMENPQMTKEQFIGFIDMSLNEYVGNIVKVARR